MAGVQAEVTEKVKTEEPKETVNGEQPTTKSEDEDVSLVKTQTLVDSEKLNF